MKTPLSHIMRIMLISFLKRHFIPVARSYFKYIKNIYVLLHFNRHHFIFFVLIFFNKPVGYLEFCF